MPLPRFLLSTHPRSCAAYVFVHFVRSSTTRMTIHARQIAFIGIVFFIICSRTWAEVTPWKECSVPEENSPSNCTIHELRVTPCKEGAQGKPCRLKRGVNATIEFDYTLNFESPTLAGTAYWTSPVIDLPFMGMENNGCVSTPCPTVPGQKQTYHQELAISKKYPVRAYDVKWKLESPSGQGCCLIFQIKIHK